MQIINVSIDDEGRIQVVDFVTWIMNEIEGKVYTRKDVAKTYAILIQKGHKDWAPINLAIMKRWSRSALLWIKSEAWKQINSPASHTTKGV